MDDFVKHKDISFLIFSIEDEDFAINVKHVIEVVRVESLTKVPKTEQYLEGILNFRGRIVSVVNANQKLNIENLKDRKNKYVIILELQFEERTVWIGLSVRRVKKVIEMTENQVQPVPEFGCYYNPEFLEGALHINEQFIMVLDITRVLSTKELEFVTSVNKTN